MVKKIKPVVFIGCSTENLETATALQEGLDYETEPFVWHQGGFPPSQYPLESLENTWKRLMSQSSFLHQMT